MNALDYPFAAPGRQGALSYKLQQQTFVYALFGTDLVSLALASALAYTFRFQFGVDFFIAGDPSLSLYLPLTILLVPAWSVLFFLYHLYDLQYLLGGTHEYARIVNASTLGMMVLVIILFFKQAVIARGWIVLFWFFSTLLVGISRFVMRRVAYAARRRGYLRVPTLIVGADAEGRAIASQLREAQSCGADVVGFLDDKCSPGEQADGIPVLGSVAQIQPIVAQHGVEEIILSTGALARDQVIEIYETFGPSPSVQLRLSPGLFEILTTGAHVKEWGYVPLVSINKVRLSEFEMWVKTIFDYTATLIGLIPLAPILLLTAIAVKLDSPGPFFHRRRVLGRGGGEFDAFKFRTMLVNGNEILSQHPELRAELESNQKLKDDPRVTRLGRFLRKYSLDELPQLFNVLLGQMSLVGPRMIAPEEADKYGKWKMNLLTVKPGIKGIWQISGRSDVSYAERVRLDMQYIRNYTFWLDFMILFRTMPAVLGGRGAY